MPGLVPGIHVLVAGRDGRDQPGHDGFSAKRPKSPADMSRRSFSEGGSLGEGGSFAKLGLTARRPLPYMPRVREVGLFRPSRPCGGVAQLVRARESKSWGRGFEALSPHQVNWA